MVECHVDATRTSSTPTPSLAPFLRRRLGLDTRRPAEDFLRSQPGWLPPADVDTSHLHLPGTGRQPVPLRLYRPRGVADPLPGLLWFHGGGFTRGGLDWGEAHPLALTLASQARIVVASVGYSTASYGHAWHDARRAWSWFTAAREALGIVGVPAAGGASAGASLALSATVVERPERTPPAAAFLGAYGLYHARIPEPDAAVAAALACLPPQVRFDTAAHTRWAALVRADLHDPGALAPAERPLDDMPPAALVSCQIDDLRPSTEVFAQTLRSRGVPVRELRVDGVIHGHLNWLPGPELPQVGQTLDFLAAAVNELTATHQQARVALTKEQPCP